MKRVFVALALLAATLPASPTTTAHAQSERALEHRAEVSRPTHHDTSSRPLRDMVETGQPAVPRGGRDFKPGDPLPVGNTNPSGVDPLAARGVAPSSANVKPMASEFGTPIDPNYRVAPPDTTGDVGPNHYVQWVNLRYSVYTLTRGANNEITAFNLVAGFPKNGNVIWQGFGGACETMNDGDPLVQYDQFADRWVLTQFAVSSSPYTQCVAVSTGPDPTGTYHRYAYSYGTDFNDYPKMGVWRDGYYITYNMFRRGRTFSGNKVCAFERDKMLTGAAARQICAQTSSSYASLMPADIEGKTLPPAGSPNPLLHIGSSAMGYWKFAVNWANGTGTLTGPTVVPGVASFSRACGGGTCIPQPGTSQQLDSLGDRLMYRLSYRNFGTHEAMVVNHSVATGGVSGIRWYEFRNAAGQTMTSATPVVHQQGTFAPSQPSAYRWMGSAAMDKTGGIAIGYNISSSSIRPSIRYAYRGPSDTLGALGNESFVLDGPGVQTGNNLSRWGDYSTISVDPVDDCTMVFTTEYIPSNGSFNWATYIHSFKLSTCQ
ncbi:MAG TPA: hypothetical protein VK421_07550 [Pyrinomonadaceae bacterium]|nr:hypothetical protein [Pyrinomonadaceae bacterium]